MGTAIHPWLLRWSSSLRGERVFAGPAGAAAEAHLVPIAFPLFAPAKRPAAGDADFFRQVFFFDAAHAGGVTRRAEWMDGAERPALRVAVAPLGFFDDGVDRLGGLFEGSPAQSGDQLGGGFHVVGVADHGGVAVGFDAERAFGGFGKE